MLLKKINFSLNQLISSDFYIGYHVSNWNTMINYYLYGSYRSYNLFNLNFTYLMFKLSFNVLSKIFLARGNLWVVYENFQHFFNKILDFFVLNKKFSFLKFYNKKWPKGLLSNSRHVIFIKKYRFPHSIFLPNVQNDSFVANEASIMHIPTFGIVDSNENPLKVFYAIPGNTRSMRSLYFLYLLLLKNACFFRNLRRVLFWKKIKKVFLRKTTKIFSSNFIVKKNLKKKKKPFSKSLDKKRFVKSINKRKKFINLKKKIAQKKKVSKILLCKFKKYKFFYVIFFYFFYKKFISFRFSNKSLFTILLQKVKGIQKKMLKINYKKFLLRLNKKKRKNYLYSLFLKNIFSVYILKSFIDFITWKKIRFYFSFLIKYFYYLFKFC